MPVTGARPIARLSSSMPLQLFLAALAVVMPCWLPMADARIYVNNETYASLPGLFGRPMAEDRTYQGRVQFLRENPYLCDDPVVDANGTSSSSFVRPTGPVIRDSHGDNITLVEPVVLLASRGECPFQRKAQVAQMIDPSVEYLIVFNFNMDSEDTLVPMYSEFGDTRLILLSATHRGGQALKHYIESQPPEVLQAGGPMLLFDAVPPEGLISVDDLRNMLLSALGLFFMLVSVSGCVMILVGSYGGQLPPLDGSVPAGIFDPPVGAGGRSGSTNGSRSNRSGLLTLEQVQRLSEWGGGEVACDTADSPTHRSETISLAASAPEAARLADEDDDVASGVGGKGHHRNDDSNCCAVCIDELVSGSDATYLPCQHRFHTECIAPWLTERQAKCPLCKYDVLEYVLNKERECDELKRAATAADPSPSRRLWNRLRRMVAPEETAYTILEGRRHRGGGVMIAPEEMMVELSESVTASSASAAVPLDPVHRSRGPHTTNTRASR